MGSDAYKAGNLPDPEKLGVVKKSDKDMDEYIKNNKQILCDMRGGSPVINAEKMGAMKTSLSFWVTRESGTDFVSTMADEGIAALLGLERIQKLSIACMENRALMHINGKDYGPFDVVYSESGKGGMWNIAAWSSKMRRMLHFTVSNDPDAKHKIIFVDVSKYIPEQGALFYALLGDLAWSIEAAVVMEGAKSGWLIKGPYGGGIYGEMSQTISKLQIQ